MRNPKTRAGYLFILPFMLFFAVFILIPILSSIFISFTDYDVLDPPKWIGLRNYRRIFFGAEASFANLTNALIREEGSRNTVLFYKSIKNTFVYVIGSVGGGLVISLCTAILFNEKWLKGRGVFRTLYFLPTVTPMAAVAFIWILMFSPRTGLINFLFVKIGIPPQGWLNDPQIAMLSIIVVSIWKGLGYSIIIFLAGLQGIPRDYYDASTVDGAGRITQVRHITLPLLMPIIAFVAITGVISSFQVFDLVYFLTSGGPLNATEVIVHLIYKAGFMPPEFKMGYASALAMVLFLIIFLFTLLQLRFFRKRQRW
jgi:multiple sugar transport system permease protein